MPSNRLKPISQQQLLQITQKARTLIGHGNVADYIPALKEVLPEQLGIAICTKDGIISAGDAQQPFSIQSISKALSLTLALNTYENEDNIWARVGKEPSGNSFNSLIQLEMEAGIPRNPFINAGALVMCDLLRSRLATPKQRMLEKVRELSDNPNIFSNKRVADSEFEHSARNAAIAYLMKSFGNFDNDVVEVLKVYFQYCAIEMSCEDLAKAFFYLANEGVSFSGQRVTSPTLTKKLNSLLTTSGLYDGAGEFAYRVGMPAKSGVGGGIVAVIPREMSICVWSPELDENGNSLAGICMLEDLSNQLHVSMF